MIKTIYLMINNTKYKRKTSKLYKKLKLNALERGANITTSGRIWVTNGKEDIFLKPKESIPKGFYRGRTIFFTEKSKYNFHKRASKAHTGIKPWNYNKKGIYSDEYRKKISDNHANMSGKNNGRYGSRTMYNTITQHRILVQKYDIKKYLDKGYVFAKDLKKFNNGIVEVLNTACPEGFKPGKLPPNHTSEELEKIHIIRSNAAKKRNKNKFRDSRGRFK